MVRRILSPAMLVVATLCATSVLAQNAPAKKTIGKLGQTIKAGSIYVSTSSSRTYSKVKQYQYLVINQTKNTNWYAVVMSNGKTGYIKSDLVATLPYDVTVPIKSAPRGTTNSRSGGGTRNLPKVTDNRAVQNMLEYSFNYIGTPYKWGGNNLEKGIDCSGFVQQLFGKIGIDLPRVASDQALVGQPITQLEDLQPGDRLYFWENRRNKIGHTGIFLGFFKDGGAYFIHSSSGRKGVATDDLRAAKWRKILVAARR